MTSKGQKNTKERKKEKKKTSMVTYAVQAKVKINVNSLFLVNDCTYIMCISKFVLGKNGCPKNHLWLLYTTTHDKTYLVYVESTKVFDYF